MQRIPPEEYLRPGSLIRVVGDIESINGEIFRTAPAFIRDDLHSDDWDPFLSDQIHIPIGSIAIVVGFEQPSAAKAPDHYCMTVLFDGLLLKSFYTYTTSTLVEVFELISDVDQCIG